MSINYTALFARVGKLVKWTNNFLAYQGTSLLGAAPNGAADDILTQYDARRDLIPNGEAFFTGASSSAAGWVGTLKGYADATFRDLQKDLSAPNNSVSTILPLLAADMTANSQSIKPAAISAPASTAGGSNVGNGLLLLSKKNAAGIDEQRIVTESVLVSCAADQYGGGSAGAEKFSVVGYPKPSSPNVYATQGNGAGPTLTVADSVNLLANGNFEAFAVTNTPDSWTVANGAVTTNIAKESANFHSGAAALKLLGDGSTATIKLTQALNTLVSASSIYGVSVWLRKSGTVTAGSTFAVTVTGTGLSTATAYSADPNGLTTAYQNFNVFFPVGTQIPSDLKINLSWTSANTAGAAAVVLVDDVVLVAPTAFGYVQYLLVRGSTDFVKGDTFTVATASDGAGIINEWMRRFYSTALPTNGSPSISDSVAV